MDSKNTPHDYQDSKEVKEDIEPITKKTKRKLKKLERSIRNLTDENKREKREKKLAKKQIKLEKKEGIVNIQERIQNTFKEISSNFSDIIKMYGVNYGRNQLQPELVKLSGQKIEFVDFTIEQHPNPKFKNVYYLKTNVKYIENGEEKHSTIGFLVDYSQPESFIYEIKWDPNNTSSVDDFDLGY